MSNTKLRVITGSVYFLILVGFFCLKIFVHPLFFDGLILIFNVIGTYEMIRAFGDKLHRSQKIVVMTFTTLILLTYIVMDIIYIEYFKINFPTPGEVPQGRNYAPHIMLVVFVAGLSVLFGLLVFAHTRVSLESVGYSFLCYFYPTVFLIVLVVCNHLTNYAGVALAFVFGISPCADMFAFAFGKTFGKKLPAKMAPNVSPNKTLIGGLGGLIGGAIGAVCVFFVYYGLCKPIEDFRLTGVLDFSTVAFNWSNLVFFLGIGVLAAAFSQFGDLVESAIKRKLDIKDMGNILPGHGGILDRIDSSLYAGLVIALIFVIRLMPTGS